MTGTCQNEQRLRPTEKAGRRHLYPRDDAKMKDDVDSDPGTGNAKEDAKLKDDDTQNRSTGYKAKPRI